MTLLLAVFVPITVIPTTACDLDDRSFIDVEAVTRFLVARDKIYRYHKQIHNYINKSTIDYCCYRYKSKMRQM